MTDVPDDFPELTQAQWAAYQRQEGAHARGAYIFDRDYYETYRRYPQESPLYGTEPPPTPRPPADDPRRQAIQNLADFGATEGERAAARAALARLDSRSEADDLEAAMIEDMDELDAEEVAEAEEFGF